MKMQATAFAPATVANVAVGFDVLGFPIHPVGDQITVSKVALNPEMPVSIHSISGVETQLPQSIYRNTATLGLIELIKDLSLDFGFEVSIQKGISLGSGMGGSAASAVGAMVAANELLDQPISQDQLLHYALKGEVVASGDFHADNVAPCLYGGLTLIQSMSPLRIIQIPVPSSIHCVLIHPHARLNTRKSRAVLKSQITLKDHVRQSACLAGLISGCFLNDIELIQNSLSDQLIEPQRAHLIHGFEEVKASALEAGAIGCSISGSGPSVFAWVSSSSQAKKVEEAMKVSFLKHGVEVDSWISPIHQKGAQVIHL